MSFQNLKKDQLLRVAEAFGSEVDESNTNNQIIAVLVEDGVTWDDAKKVLNVEEEETPAPTETPEENPEAGKKKQPMALLKMTRANRTFDIRGVRFTHDHPFALVPEDDADWIVENVEGFRHASPKEAKEYYG